MSEDSPVPEGTEASEEPSGSRDAAPDDPIATDASILPEDPDDVDLEGATPWVFKPTPPRPLKSPETVKYTESLHGGRILKDTFIFFGRHLHLISGLAAVMLLPFFCIGLWFDDMRYAVAFYWAPCVLNIFMMGAVIHAVVRTRNHEPVRFSQCLAASLPRSMMLLLLAAAVFARVVLYAMIPFIFANMMLSALNPVLTILSIPVIIVPAVVVVLKVWVGAPVVVVEKLDPAPATERSHALTEGFRRDILSIFTVLLVLNILVVYLCSTLMLQSDGSGSLIRIGIVTLIVMTFHALFAIAVTHTYFRLVAIKGEYKDSELAEVFD